MRARVALLGFLLPAAVLGQNFAGDWQGLLKSAQGDLRVVLHIAQDRENVRAVTLYSPDQGVGQGTEGAAARSVSLEGSRLRFEFGEVPDRFEGKFSSDGKALSGTVAERGGSVALNLKRATANTGWLDPVAHKVRFVTVEPGVNLEVLDWGGSGRPVILLAGLGNNAHIFDKFAPKLTGKYHVYGITRRGFGASDRPAFTAINYAADRLGDDVLTVIESLRLDRPVLIGHSRGGAELSSVGSRRPETVAGLVYLEAAYSYAYSTSPPGDATLPAAVPDTAVQAMQAGTQNYSEIRAPILAIFAYPQLKADAGEVETAAAQIKAFESGNPSARVVRLANADHFVFRSHEAGVLREINSFIAGLR